MIGYVSKETYEGRILAHRRITSLINGFKLMSGNPFTIFIIPKVSITLGVISLPQNAGILVDCKLYQDDESSDFPVLFNQWTEAAIAEIAANAIDLETYDVYWGCGTDVQES